MNEKTDSILNEYIDGNLSSAEIEELNKQLSNSPEITGKLKGLKVVDSHLKEMESLAAPSGITGRIMQKLESAFARNLPKSYFLHTIVSLFAIAFTGMLIFFFTYFSNPEQEYSIADNSVKVVNTFITDFVKGISAKLAGSDLILIISIVTLILMLSIYFLFESHKSHRKKLQSIMR